MNEKMEIVLQKIQKMAKVKKEMKKEKVLEQKAEKMANSIPNQKLIIISEIMNLN